ncbi:hypothetical protein FXN61_21295 [Lentzea sp. PSKA42]|uniref:Uncharacterized protein n=1 Tax=Lentzea indica TaxID=2604800 RepID=A0ABX1FKV4_9PSEU|nr:hypothetical protein [Lentzea indica]NKE59212.1 hypothetical protein [Lentzea indica]
MRRSSSVPLAGLLLALMAAPALAQPPTTPVPGPRDPNQPPASAPNGPQPLAHAVGDAGTGLSVVRLGPQGVPTNTILPGLSDQLPKQSVTEFGLGLASAQVNTEAFLSTERVVTQASPFGFAVGGRSPQSPGTLVQTAIPDNPQPANGGLPVPETPLAKLSLLNGSVHARWDEKLGPCVSPLATARTSLAGLQVLSALPAEVPLPAKTSLISIPDTFEAHSQVRLVDLPGSKNKAVESTSTMRAVSVELAGGVKIDVASPPTLTATATGDEKTSKITYTAPVLKVSQNGKELGTLDAAHPALDIPLLLDLVVIKLQIAGLNEKKAAFTGNGFSGFQLGATARMLDVQVLPTDKLKLPNLPAALAQISLGEQIVRAAAPQGGVVCGTAQTNAPQEPGGAAAPPKKTPPLASTNAVYQSIPLFWTGTGLLLAGVVVVAALPVRGRSRVRAPEVSKP